MASCADRVEGGGGRHESHDFVHVPDGQPRRVDGDDRLDGLRLQEVTRLVVDEAASGPVRVVAVTEDNLSVGSRRVRRDGRPGPAFGIRFCALVHRRGHRDVAAVVGGVPFRAGLKEGVEDEEPVVRVSHFIGHEVAEAASPLTVECDVEGPLIAGGAAIADCHGVLHPGVSQIFVAVDEIHRVRAQQGVPGSIDSGGVDRRALGLGPAPRQARGKFEAEIAVEWARFEGRPAGLHDVVHAIVVDPPGDEVEPIGEGQVALQEKRSNEKEGDVVVFGVVGAVVSGMEANPNLAGLDRIVNGRGRIEGRPGRWVTGGRPSGIAGQREGVQQEVLAGPIGRHWDLYGVQLGVETKHPLPVLLGVDDHALAVVHMLEL